MILNFNDLIIYKGGEDKDFKFGDITMGAKIKF